MAAAFSSAACPSAHRWMAVCIRRRGAFGSHPAQRPQPPQESGLGVVACHQRAYGTRVNSSEVKGASTQQATQQSVRFN